MITRDALEAAMNGGRAFIHPDEIDPLCRYAKASYRLVELGTGYGACACLMLLASSSHATVYSVDPFTRDTHGTWQSSPAIAHQHVQHAAQVLKFDATRWTLYVMSSHEAAEKAAYARARFDLVFVDGDHTYEAVQQDVNDWLPLLRVGGVLLLHDSRRLPDKPAAEFHRGWPGPTQVANDLRTDARVELVEEIHSLTAWRKL